MCLWHNPLPHSRVDDFDWLRQYSFGGTGPKYDHTKKTPEGGLLLYENLKLKNKTNKYFQVISLILAVMPFSPKGVGREPGF